MLNLSAMKAREFYKKVKELTSFTFNEYLAIVCIVVLTILLKLIL